MPCIRINGAEREFDDGTTVAGLLETLGRNAKWVAVERNRRVVSREAYATTELCDGDVVEIVSLVGGG